MCEEMVARVDEQDKLLWMKLRSEFDWSEYIHRSVWLILLNEDGDICIGKRWKHKVHSPDLYSYIVSGFVWDESYDEAIQREVKEELWLDIRCIFMFRYFDKVVWKNAHRKCIYVAHVRNYTKIFNSETDKIVWLKIDDLKLSIISCPKKYTPWFKKWFQFFLDTWYIKNS